MELDGDFEDDLRAAVMDDVERTLAEDRLIEQAIERSHERLQTVADRNGYDVENVIGSLEGPDIKREDNRIRIEWGWTHEAANLFATGTDDHVIQGNPVVSFIWEGAPQDIVAQFSERWDPSPRVYFSEVEVSGIEQSRYTRHGLRWLENELRK